MSDRFRTYLCPTAIVTTAQAAAAQYAGGEGMFTTPCSPTGQMPATHYISSGFVTHDIDDTLHGVEEIAISTEEPLTMLINHNLYVITPSLQ